jgi:hypothetical protein
MILPVLNHPYFMCPCAYVFVLQYDGGEENTQGRGSALKVITNAVPPSPPPPKKKHKLISPLFLLQPPKP